MINAGLIGAASMFLYAAVMFVMSFSLKYSTAFGPGPGFFPMWISGLLLLVSALYIWESIKKDVIRGKDVMPPKESHMRILCLLGGLLFFYLSANQLGFFVAGVILLFLMFIWDYKWLPSLALSFAYMIVLWLIFSKFLKVSLPTNFLGF